MLATRPCAFLAGQMRSRRSVWRQQERSRCASSVGRSRYLAVVVDSDGPGQNHSRADGQQGVEILIPSTASQTKAEYCPLPRMRPFYGATLYHLYTIGVRTTEQQKERRVFRPPLLMNLSQVIPGGSGFAQRKGDGPLQRHRPSLRPARRKRLFIESGTRLRNPAVIFHAFAWR
jgi:hypothetical protein